MSIDSRKLVKNRVRLKQEMHVWNIFYCFGQFVSGDTVSEDLIGIDGDLGTRLFRIHNHFYIRSIPQ